MPKQTYTNRPLSLDEQIAMLKSRGLQIDDEAFAKRQLQIISPQIRNRPHKMTQRSKR